MLLLLLLLPTVAAGLSAEGCWWAWLPPALLKMPQDPDGCKEFLG